MLTPSELSAKTTNYNEVLVIGRPDLNIHEGMPPTANVKVAAILLIRKKIPPKFNGQYIELAKAMSAANNNVPILYINDLSDTVNNSLILTLDEDKDSYLACAEGIKTIKHVYDIFLSKPFTKINLPGAHGSNNDVFLDTPGGRINRPNHGLAHTLRVANAVKVIAEMYNWRLPRDSQIPLIIIQQKQFTALFSVIGRVNEMSAEQSEDYKKKMNQVTSFYEESHLHYLEGVSNYKKQGYLHIFNSSEAMAVNNSLTNKAKYEKLGNEIYRAAHNIDLMRCYDKTTFERVITEPGHDGMKCLKDMIGSWLTNIMLDYHRDIIKATGDRCFGFEPQANYNLSLFGRCSQDFNYCLQQINSVGKYNFL